MSDKVRNPLTGRMISTNGRVYQQLIAAGTIQIENGSMNQAPAPQPAIQPIVQFTSESIQPAVQPIIIPQPTQDRTERFGKTYRREPYTINADTPEELFQSILNTMESTSTQAKVVVYITFRNRFDPNMIRQVSIRGADMQSLDDFMEYFENLREGQVAGSDAASSDEWELIMNSFALGRIAISDTVNGTSAKIIYECEGVADKRPKTEKKEHYCVKKSLEHFGHTFNEKMVVDGNYTRLFESLDNKICHNNIVSSSLRREMFRNGVRINGSYYLPITLGDVFHMDGPSDAKYIVDLSCQDMHMDVLKQPIRIKPNLFLDSSYEIVEIVDGKVKKNNRAELRRTVEAPQEKRPDYFMFFDFETHVDWDDRSCMKAYSLSTFLCTNEILVALEKADKAGNKKECERIRAENCKTYIGYDCATRFWDEFFFDSLDKNVHFVSFNGCYFDNLILLRAYIKWRTDNNAKYVIDKELFVNGGLLNMRIEQRHDFFDVAKHLLGSLKELCKGFKVKCCAKREFDHHKMQKLADEGDLIDFCNSSPELREYNEYDVLSLAVIFARYRAALEAIPASKAYAAELHTISTISSLSKMIWIDHVKKEYGVGQGDQRGYADFPDEPKNDDGTFNFQNEEPRLLAQNSKFQMPTKTDKDGNAVQVKLGHNESIFPKLPMNVYNDLLDGKSAGRVQCFQGVTKFIGSIVSYDVCSLYPYILAVCPNYFPAGNIVETAPGEFHADLCGFYWINADQSNLQHQNLPLILPIKARDKNGNIVENDYNSRDGIITNCCVTHQDVLQLKKYGCRVDIIGGFYFTHRVKSCDLFRPILDFMQAKNQQDTLSKKKDPSYNAPLRETLKLLMNSLSGKIIQGLFLDKVMRATEKKLRELASKYDISCVTVVGGSECIVQYKREQDECMHCQSPVYLGAYVYAYARAHMYNYGYAHVGLKNLLYTDTDSIKFPSACVESYQEATKGLVVPHWPEVLAYDARYAGHKLFDPKSKVFGSFEDELAKIKNSVFYCVQKKVWCVALNSLHSVEDDYDEWLTGTCVGVQLGASDEVEEWFINVKWRGKGFNSRSVLVADDFQITSQKDAQYFIHDSSDSVGVSDMKIGVATNQVVLFERLWKERTANLLCSTFKKIIKNTRRNVAVDDASKHQQLFCRVQVCANLKKINIKEIERPICTVLDSEGKICIRL